MALFSDKPQRPFSGYPRTRRRKDWRGREWYVVDIRYLSPFGAKAGDNLGSVMALGLLCAAIYSLSDNNVTIWWAWAAGLIAPFALVDLWRWLCRRLLRSHTRVKLSRNLISIRRRRLYNRDRVTGFVLLEDYDRMHAERRKAQHLNMIAQRSKAMPAKPRPLYHGERTRQVACRMDGELVPICTVFGQQEFMAICVRLNAINDALNAELGAGLGRPLDPSADSPQGRGGIPE